VKRKNGREEGMVVLCEGDAAIMSSSLSSWNDGMIMSAFHCSAPAAAVSSK
jgi:hypothetical protein